MATAEHLLIARVYVEHLVSQQQWVEAADAAHGILKMAADDQHTLGVAGASELARIACAVANLGMVGDISPALLGSLIRKPLDDRALKDAVAAMRTVCGDNFADWKQALSSAADGSAESLRLLDAACAHLDGTVAPWLLSAPFVGTSVRTHLGYEDDEKRGRGLQVVARLLRLVVLVV